MKRDRERDEMEKGSRSNLSEPSVVSLKISFIEVYYRIDFRSSTLEKWEKARRRGCVSLYVCKKLYTDESERSEIRRKEANSGEKRKPKWKKLERGFDGDERENKGRGEETVKQLDNCAHYRSVAVLLPRIAIYAHINQKSLERGEHLNFRHLGTDRETRERRKREKN